MNEVRVLQLATSLAYLALGVIAALAAIRRPERARLDIALLFGATGIAVAVQEIGRLSDAEVPGGPRIVAVLVLALPVLLLRLVDNVQDVPRWQLALAGLLFVGLSAALVALDPPPAPVSLLVILYLVVGVVYAAAAFWRRARATAGITSRRMLAAAAGCVLLALVFAISGTGVALPDVRPYFTLLSQLAGLLSGLCFYAAFFPPAVLRQTWRLPELFTYLGATRWNVEGATAPATQPHDGPEPSAAARAEMLALDHLLASVARTTGAQRVLLALEDAARGDFYLWGSPSARVGRGEGLIGTVAETGRPLVVRQLTRDQVAGSVRALLSSSAFPRTAMVAPVSWGGHTAGALAVYGGKGSLFLEDDLDMLTFFAAEVGAILRDREHRETVHELAALREADRLKDEFMAVVSHELRTPLTAISGYSDILLRQIAGPLTDRQQRQVVGIREAARRLLTLINDLLDVSKLEAGTLDLRLAPVDAQEALRRAITGTRVLASAKGIQLRIEAPPDGELLPPVLADEERLQQILTNLLANAIKFTQKQGEVVASARSATSADRADVVFSVRDTGVGIPSDQLARVWDRFYQGDSTSTRRFGGTGLGLSIVKRLVELHGGTVEAVSAGANQGSTFSVRLPAAMPGATAPAPAATPDARASSVPSSGSRSATAPAPATSAGALPPRAPGPRGDGVAARPAAGPGGDAAAGPGMAANLVLVVEDDPDIATVIQAYLESEGYRAQVARDGQQALQLARAMRPFAITLDVMLPKLDGWSVLNALKREPATADIPVIVLSIVDNREFGLVLGASEYLVKPVDPDRLRAVLGRLAGTPSDRLGGHLLLVDDDPAICDVLSTALEQDGWQVEVAHDGEDALRAVQQRPPAALVLDLMMPGLDGFAVLHALREDRVTAHLPVIVVTARELTDADRAHLAGAAQRVIQKQGAAVESVRQQLSRALAAYRPAEAARATNGVGGVGAQQAPTSASGERPA